MDSMVSKVTGALQMLIIYILAYIHAKRVGVGGILFYIRKLAETQMLCLLVSLSSITVILFFYIKFRF
jgi:hypothetical protein